MDDVIVGWQAAAAASKRTESWLRRHLDLTNGIKNDDGIWEFPREVLEHLRPDGADVGDDDTEVVSIRSGVVEPVEVVSIRSEPHPPARPSGGAAVDTPSAPAVDENGITAAQYAAVFASYDQGKRIADVVRECALLPRIAEFIASEWRRVNAVDLNSPTVPAVVAKLERKVATLESRLRAQSKCLHDTVEAYNALADDLDAQGPADVPTPDVDEVGLAARVEELTAAVDAIRDFLKGFVPAVLLRREIGSVVRDKLLLLLPSAVRQMFGAPVPPGTSEYYEA